MSKDIKGNGKTEAPDDNLIGIPPQAKYGIAVFEMDNGQVQEIPIVPPETESVTYGQLQRLLYSALQNVEMSIFAGKLKRELGIKTKKKGGLVGPDGSDL